MSGKAGMKKVQTRRFAVSEQPHTETVIAAVIAAAHWALVIPLGPLAHTWADPWEKIDGNAQQVIFQTGAGVVAIMASLAALGLATGGAGDRAKEMRRLYGAVLRRNWRALLLTSAIAPMLAISAQILSASGAAWGPYLFEFAALWTALRLARLAWLVDGILGKQIEDDAELPEVGKFKVFPDADKRNTA